MLTPVRTPQLIRKLGYSMEWSYPRAVNSIFLTFDDGPIPQVTPWALDMLGHFGARATFFCVGENAEKHPEILRRIRSEGHRVGNHTHNHLNGWKTPDRQYFRNVGKAQMVLHSNLFRPPYGRITPRQAQQLRRHYRIIMWSVLTQDYDKSITPEKCLENSLKARSGDIVIFHDSLKAWKNLEYALPRFLEYYTAKGFNFALI